MPPRNGYFEFRRVAGQHDAVDAQRHDAEGIEDADVESAMTIFCPPRFEPNGMMATFQDRGIMTIAGASQ